jgi:hypothetical protein
MPRLRLREQILRKTPLGIEVTHGHTGDVLEAEPAALGTPAAAGRWMFFALVSFVLMLVSIKNSALAAWGQAPQSLVKASVSTDHDACGDE